MKKKLFYILLTSFIICPNLVQASTNTFERTKDNLRIPDKINYKESMYNNVITTPSINENEKIYDFANIFTDEEEQQIYTSTISFIEQTNLDLAVVTINYNNKKSTQEYADDFYDYNNFKIDGLVYVIDMDNREFYISTSGQAILYIDNNRVEYILTNMDNSMYNGNYKESVDILIRNSLDYYHSGISNTTQNKYEVIDGIIYYKTPYLILIIISLIAATIVTLILSLRNKKVKLAQNSDLYLASNGIKITDRQDVFLNSHTERVYSPISSDSGGGSSSGGSHHSGSSGMSHGGGGHRF